MIEDTAPHSPVRRRGWMRRLRWVADTSAIFAAWLFVFAMTGSMLAGFAAAVFTGLYGLWCFTDGATSV